MKKLTDAICFGILMIIFVPKVIEGRGYKWFKFLNSPFCFFRNKIIRLWHTEIKKYYPCIGNHDLSVKGLIKSSK